MTNLFLKPAHDADGQALIIKDPQTFQPLRTDGEWKVAQDYWYRRIRDGEVIDASAEQNATAATLPPVSPVA